MKVSLNSYIKKQSVTNYPFNDTGDALPRSVNVITIELVVMVVEAFNLDGSVRNIKFLLAHFSS